MTRVNSAIPVRFLTDEHLLAEHREIRRLPWFYKRHLHMKKDWDIPKEFTLGKGHISFFMDKFKFTHDRYIAIDTECNQRHFNIQDFSLNWNIIPVRLYNDYTPTIEEKDLLIDRIVERINNSPKRYWHYYGHRISKETAILLVKGRLKDITFDDGSYIRIN